MVFLLLGLIVARPAVAAVPPNIVFIISDDHAWTGYGPTEDKQMGTPNLEMLAVSQRAFKPVAGNAATGADAPHSGALAQAEAREANSRSAHNQS